MMPDTERTEASMYGFSRRVDAIDASLMATATGNDRLSDVAATVNEKLRRVIKTF